MQTGVVQALSQPSSYRGAGMPTLTSVVVHPQVTGRSQYQYQFTPKHHGADVTAAQWLPSLSFEEEFAVFDTADQHDLSDSDGRLYGVGMHEQEELPFIGTWNQQIAEFPCPRE